MPTANLIATIRQTALDRLLIGVARRPDWMGGIDRSDDCAVRCYPKGWKPPRLDADRRGLMHLGSAGSKILCDGLFDQYAMIAALENGLGNMATRRTGRHEGAQDDHH